MKKFKIPVIIILLLYLSAAALSALDTKNIIAYPVPFNPKKGIIRIGTTDGTLTGYSVKAEIYDINGDIVRTISGTPSGTPAVLVWNGRNENGNYVKPGMYIIKITAENTADGDYGKKIIRILVDY